MDKAVKERWVTALRSGEFAQGQEYLELNNEYCCLGVLCAIEGIPMLELGGEDLSDNRAAYRTVIEMIDGTKRADLADFRKFPLTEELMKMNDNGDDFNEIADWIEVAL